MKVAVLSTNDINGGAAIAAFRLHQGLRQCGVGSRMMVRRKDSEDAAVVPLPAQLGLRGKLQNAWNWSRNQVVLRPIRHQRLPGSEYFSHFRGRLDADWSRLLEDIDVVNVHWITDFIQLHTLVAALPRSVPIVWTLHDMNAFTGGCHYSEGCTRFRQECGRCPQLHSNKSGDFSRRGWHYKNATLEALDSARLVVVTPSQWLGRQSRSSSILGTFRHEVIPYGLDIEAFHPVDQASARQALELPESRPVVLALAAGFNNRRKGLPLLFEAVGRIPRDRRPAVAIAGELGEGAPPLPDDVIYLGFLDSAERLRTAYSAADASVSTASEDNLPNTVLESLACGTPVVAFEVGGIPDMVEHGVTGWLAPPMDVDALSDHLAALADQPGLAAGMRPACRASAEQRYPLELQAERYHALFESLVAEANARKPS